MNYSLSWSKYLVLAITIPIITGMGMMVNPKRNRYLIPEKFHGTVYVYYNVKDALPLPMEDGYRLIIVPDNGIVKTSSEIMGGKFHDEYWLYSGERKSLMSPHKLGGGYTVKQKNNMGEDEIIHEFDVLKEEKR